MVEVGVCPCLAVELSDRSLLSHGSVDAGLQRGQLLMSLLVGGHQKIDRQIWSMQAPEISSLARASVSAEPLANAWVSQSCVARTHEATTART